MSKTSKAEWAAALRALRQREVVRMIDDPSAARLSSQRQIPPLTI